MGIIVDEDETTRYVCLECGFSDEPTDEASSTLRIPTGWHSPRGAKLWPNFYPPELTSADLSRSSLAQPRRIGPTCSRMLRLITRKSQVQILPPLLKALNTGYFAERTTGRRGNSRLPVRVRTSDARRSAGSGIPRFGVSAPDVRRRSCERRTQMKGIHPERTITNVHCTSCGNVFATRSSPNELVLDMCSSCHPAYTGVAREVVRGSRVERFERRRAQAAAA